jgi:hypothetical protein
MTQATIYRDSDGSAPQLTGETGKLTDLLKACLVDGYGSKSAAGWTREYYDDTTKTAVFKPGAGPAHYWQVQDNGPGAGTYKEARSRGYVSMTAYNSGSEPFPTVAQYANGQFIRKSNTANSTVRNWVIAADDRTCHLFIDAGDASAYYLHYMFGQFNSWKDSDAYNTCHAMNVAENNTSYNGTAHPSSCVRRNSAGYDTLAVPRAYTGLSGAVQVGFQELWIFGNNGTGVYFGGSGATYPYPVDGSLLISPIWIHEGGLYRGRVRGIWTPQHNTPLLHLDTFSLTDGATTRDFVAQKMPNGMCFIETSDTWDVE